MDRDETWLGLRLLLLPGLANTAPLVAKRWLGSRWATPLDGGLRFFDGRPLLGASKTVRGALAAIVATALGALILGLPVTAGAFLGAWAMLSDACPVSSSRASVLRRAVAPPASITSPKPWCRCCSFRKRWG
ncbi:MAG: hypothetical protein ACXWCE_07645 [Caldimonas sp.]